jgi:hypothetical protein
VLALEVVLADGGRVVRTGSRAVKTLGRLQPDEPDHRLQGTLGVIRG